MAETTISSKTDQPHRVYAVKPGIAHNRATKIFTADVVLVYMVKIVFRRRLTWPDHLSPKQASKLVNKHHDPHWFYEVIALR